MSAMASLQEQQAEPLAIVSDAPTEKKVKKKKAAEGLALMPLDGDVTTLNPLAVAALSPDGMLPSPLGGEAKKKKKKLQRAGTLDESAGIRRKKKGTENGTEASSAAGASATSPTSPSPLIAGEGLIFHKR